MTMYYEQPEECAQVIGFEPNRTYVGMAIDDYMLDPCAVIWQETVGGFAAPVFLPSRHVHIVTAEAMRAALCNPNWLVEHLAKREVPS